MNAASGSASPAMKSQRASPANKAKETTEKNPRTPNTGGGCREDSDTSVGDPWECELEPAFSQKGSIDRPRECEELKR